MKFQKILMITGTNVRQKKDGSPYYMVHILMENGQTCSLMYKGNVDIFNSLKPMEKYLIDFDIVFSNYGTRVEVLNIAIPGK